MNEERWILVREADGYPHTLAIPVGGDIPNPMNGNFDELNEWVKQNVANGYRYTWDRRGPFGVGDTLLIQFEDKNEAMMFKLRWGGA